MAQMKAKYAGVCRRCGGRINVGDDIDWTKETGACHVTCKENIVKISKSCSVSTPIVPIQKVLEPIPTGLENEQVRLFWSDGEYLSGWMPSGSKPAIEWLEKLGLCHYVSGWGMHFERDAASETLVPGITIANGGSFTVKAADDFARPGINKRFETEYQTKIARLDKRAQAFAESISTGKPVILRSWSEECDGSVDECDVDNLYEYAMPNGTTKIERNHSY